ncbi:uncharacterized protein LOC142334498 isoform X3 [Convolutriloba macropyga]|uniref:uncharacterized protein LOC142334498 isoform X3 n=1 Tax=Convolutriloba macropyga TaxID=536237 RepID=UPI003F5271AB
MIFDGLQLAFEFGAKDSFSAKKDLKSLVKDNGGVVSYVVNKQIFALIISNASLATSSKSKRAIQLGCKVLDVNFLHACVQEGCLVDPDLYSIARIQSKDSFHSGVIKVIQSDDTWPSATEKEERFKIEDAAVMRCSLKDGQLPVDNYTHLKGIVLYDDFNNEVVSIEINKLNAKCHLSNGSEIETPFIVMQIGPVNLTEESRLPCDDAPVKIYPFQWGRFAVECYAKLIESLEKDQKMKRYSPENLTGQGMTASKIATIVCSAKFKQVILMNDKTLTPIPEVKDLLQVLYKEANGSLDDLRESFSLGSCKRETICEALGYLKQLKFALRKDNADVGVSSQKDMKVSTLSKKFFECIPHSKTFVLDLKGVAQKMDMCQVILDMLTIGESTNWNPKPPIDTMYHALGARLTPVQWSDLTELVNLLSILDGSVEIQQVFEVLKLGEVTSFKSSVGNVRTLLHGTSSTNMIGVLARGLLLPNVVTDEYGVPLTDIGKLGSGIYFSDELSTSLKYTSAAMNGRRYLMVCDVACGKEYETSQLMTGITEPPKGFDSVVTNEESAFFERDREIVVYSPNQVRLKYLVVLKVKGDMEDTGLSFSQNLLSEETGQLDEVTAKDRVDIESGLEKLKSLKPPEPESGLLPEKGSRESVPLQAVHVRGKIVDLAAQVVVLQTYKNANENESIEAKYVFPLDEFCSVVGFEAFINGKHIVGEVKEKETARKEYKKAISQGHGAYLMEEDKETPNVFSVAVGNLPPKATVVIKITYVTELQVEGSDLKFSIPGAVAPWNVKNAKNDDLQSTVKSVLLNDDALNCNEGGSSSSFLRHNFSLQLNLEMPFKIVSLKSQTHKHLKTKRTETMAVCELPNGTSDGTDASSISREGFDLLIGLNEIHKPRMWVEKLPLKPEEQATMLTFYPEFQSNSNLFQHKQQVLILVDLSNSMKHDEAYMAAIQLACLTLWTLSTEYLFNVITFGSDFEELFHKSAPNTEENRNKAIQFLTEKAENFKPMGSTDPSKPIDIMWELFNHNLKRYAEKRKSQALKTTLLLLSDGHISQPTQSNISAIFEENSSDLNFRLFANGVSSSCDKHTLRLLCDKGAGFFEFFDSSTKSSWMKKVKSQIEKFSQHVLTNVSVKWVLHEDKDDASLFEISNPNRIIQAPANLTALFDGQRVVVYGFVPFCQEAILEAELNGQKVSTSVSTSDHMTTEGKLVHQLAARAVIRDWESNAMLHSDKATHEFAKAEMKKTIIQLSLRHQVVTQFTSFVAIEKRTEGEEVNLDTSFVHKIINDEDVDLLKYVGWENEIIIKTPQENFEELLKRGMSEKTYSVLEATATFKSAHAIMIEHADSLPAVQLIEFVASYVNILKDAQSKVDGGSSDAELLVCECIKALSSTDKLKPISDEAVDKLKYLYDTIDRPVALKTVQPMIVKLDKALGNSLLDRINVRVVELTGAVSYYDITQFETCGILKKQIQEKKGIPASQQRLVFNGQQLLDNTVLTEAGINDGDTIHMVLRLRGGPPVAVVDSAYVYTSGLRTDKSPLQSQTLDGRPPHQGASVPDTPPVVVIDAGSMYTKAGLHTDESPLQYQTVVGRPRHQGVMVGMGQKDCYVGSRSERVQLSDPLSASSDTSRLAEIGEALSKNIALSLPTATASNEDSRPKLGKLPTMLRSLKARNASFSIKSYGSSGRRSDGQIALQQEEKLEEITDKLDAIRDQSSSIVEASKIQNMAQSSSGGIFGRAAVPAPFSSLAMNSVSGGFAARVATLNEKPTEISLFGAPVTSSSFGSVAHTSGESLFGQTNAASAGLFRSTSSEKQPGLSLFGVPTSSSSSNNAASTFAGSLFGQPNADHAGIFGTGAISSEKTAAVSFSGAAPTSSFSFGGAPLSGESPTSLSTFNGAASTSAGSLFGQSNAASGGFFGTRAPSGRPSAVDLFKDRIASSLFGSAAPKSGGAFPDQVFSAFAKTAMPVSSPQLETAAASATRSAFPSQTGAQMVTNSASAQPSTPHYGQSRLKSKTKLLGMQTSGTVSAPVAQYNSEIDLDFKSKGKISRENIEVGEKSFVLPQQSLSEVQTPLDSVRDDEQQRSRTSRPQRFSLSTKFHCSASPPHPPPDVAGSMSIAPSMYMSAPPAPPPVPLSSNAPPPPPPGGSAPLKTKLAKATGSMRRFSSTLQPSSAEEARRTMNKIEDTVSDLQIGEVVQCLTPARKSKVVNYSGIDISAVESADANGASDVVDTFSAKKKEATPMPRAGKLHGSVMANVRPCALRSIRTSADAAMEVEQPVSFETQDAKKPQKKPAIEAEKECDIYENIDLSRSFEDVDELCQKRSITRTKDEYDPTIEDDCLYTNVQEYADFEELAGKAECEEEESDDDCGFALFDDYSPRPEKGSDSPIERGTSSPGLGISVCHSATKRFCHMRAQSFSLTSDDEFLNAPYSPTEAIGQDKSSSSDEDDSASSDSIASSHSSGLTATEWIERSGEQLRLEQSDDDEGLLLGQSGRLMCTDHLHTIYYDMKSSFCDVDSASSGDLNEVLESNFCSAEVVEIMETGGDEKKLRKVSGLLDIGNGCGKCTAVYTRVVKVMLLIGGKSLGIKGFFMAVSLMLMQLIIREYEESSSGVHDEADLDTFKQNVRKAFDKYWYIYSTFNLGSDWPTGIENFKAKCLSNDLSKKNQPNYEEANSQYII